MSLELKIAIYSATVSTIVLLIEIFRLISEKPEFRSYITAFSNYDDGKRMIPCIALSIVNEGKQATTIRYIYLVYWKSWIHKILGKNIIVSQNPNFLHLRNEFHLPAQLNVGAEWIGFIKHDKKTKFLTKRKLLHLLIVTTYSNKPLVYKVYNHPL